MKYALAAMLGFAALFSVAAQAAPVQPAAIATNVKSGVTTVEYGEYEGGYRRRRLRYYNSEHYYTPGYRNRRYYNNYDRPHYNNFYRPFGFFGGYNRGYDRGYN